jgi:CRISPR-associated endoribonuclease Cas6
MRLRLEITTQAREVPWASVLAPGRGIAYDLLAGTAPELGVRLHDAGWGPYGMVPIGHGAPLFPTARRTRGVYAAGGPGVIEFGSPLVEVVEAWARALKQRDVLDWGGVAFRLHEVSVLDPPDFGSGRARMRTQTPVVLKGSGLDGQGARTTRQAWLLPMEPEFPSYFERNLQRKAETLDLPPDVYLASITWVGSRRSFAVSGGAKPGAPVEVDLQGDPEVLRAIWSWGLGQANAAGFGWVAA